MEGSAPNGEEPSQEGQWPQAASHRAPPALHTIPGAVCTHHLRKHRTPQVSGVSLWGLKNKN